MSNSRVTFIPGTLQVFKRPRTLNPQDSKPWGVASPTVSPKQYQTTVTLDRKTL